MAEEIKQFLFRMKDNFENVQTVVDSQDVYYIMGLDKKFQKNKKGDNL